MSSGRGGPSGVGFVTDLPAARRAFHALIQVSEKPIVINRVSELVEAHLRTDRTCAAVRLRQIFASQRH
jgi:hypothetical protein